MNEASKSGKGGFLVDSVIAWENAINKIESDLLRKVIIRIGIVLSTKGGALPKMAGGVVLNAVPYFGDGKQIYSWIHIEDLCRMFLFALQKENINGIVNGVAPHPVTNEEMCRKILQVRGKADISFGVPEFVLRLVLGEMADVVLTGSNIRPEAILKNGFKFNFNDVEAALSDVFTLNK